MLFIPGLAAAEVEAASSNSECMAEAKHSFYLSPSFCLPRPKPRPVLGRAAVLNPAYGCGGLLPPFSVGGSTGQAASLPPHPPTRAPASAAAPIRMKDSMPVPTTPSIWPRRYLIVSKPVLIDHCRLAPRARDLSLNERFGLHRQRGQPAVVTHVNEGARSLRPIHDGVDGSQARAAHQRPTAGEHSHSESGATCSCRRRYTHFRCCLVFRLPLLPPAQQATQRARGKQAKRSAISKHDR